MKKFSIFLVLLIAISSVSKISAQVTIGSNAEPDANAVLDLVSTTKGLLLPRVALTRTDVASPISVHTAGITVYNTHTTLIGESIPFEYWVSPGLYYNDGTKWVRLPMGYTNWFYMPSVSFDTSTTGNGRTKDLYLLYYNQFKTPVVASAGAPASVPYIPARTDLYYYITEYDTNVFSDVSINANGVMTYDVDAAATDCSFINIVFVLK